MAHQRITIRKIHQSFQENGSQMKEIGTDTDGINIEVLQGPCTSITNTI